MENTNKKSLQRSNKRQIAYLCQYMAQHTYFAAGDYSSPMGAKKHAEQWEQLKSALDELGPSRSIDQWKICWRDQKRKARAEGAALNKAKTATGNIVPVPELSDNSALVLDTIGREVAIGFGPAESGIGSAEPSTSHQPAPSNSHQAAPSASHQPAPSTSHQAAPSASDLAAPSASHQPALSTSHQAAPSASHQATSSTQPRTDRPVRTAAARPRRVRRTLPPDQFLNAQLELNNLIRELLQEIRRSNDLREEHLNFLRR